MGACERLCIYIFAGQAILYHAPLHGLRDPILSAEHTTSASIAFLLHLHQCKDACDLNCRGYACSAATVLTTFDSVTHDMLVNMFKCYMQILKLWAVPATEADMQWYFAGAETPKASIPKPTARSGEIWSGCAIMQSCNATLL